MLQVPLYAPNLIADAWHQVRAPGGYEWWYFDAEDPATHTQIVAIFLEGFVFHPEYLRKHFAYLRRPTRQQPVVPRDYPCAYFVVYRGGRIAHQFMVQYPPTEFAASIDEPQVSIGPNRMIRDDRGYQLTLRGVPWQLTWRGPRFIEGTELSAELTFTPTLPHPPHERNFFSRELAGADHHWVIAAPLCRVSGRIRCGEETIDFNGAGYHDHNYGTGPIGPGLRRWFWGRVLLEDAVCTFHLAEARRRELRPEIHLVEADASSAREHAVDPVPADWNRWSSLGLRYPRMAQFGQILRLSNPRLIDSAPFYMRVMYEAHFRHRLTTAFCEVAYPHRLRWPVLGRMIQMSIRREPWREEASEDARW